MHTTPTQRHRAAILGVLLGVVAAAAIIVYGTTSGSRSLVALAGTALVGAMVCVMVGAPES